MTSEDRTRGLNASSDGGRYSSGSTAVDSYPNVPHALVLGPVGSGKSTFIQAATRNSKVEIGHNAESCTQVCTSYPVVDSRGHTRLILIDTPGFDDADKDDFDTLLRIAKFVSDIPVGVSGVIYAHRITETRLDGEARLNLDIFKAICGEEFFSRFVVCSTMWNTMPPDSTPEQQQAHAQRRAAMEGLLYDSGAFGRIMAKGAEYREFWSDREDPCRDILNHFASQRKQPTLAIVDQLKDWSVQNTEAARVIKGSREREERKGSERLRKIGGSSSRHQPSGESVSSGFWRGGVWDNVKGAVRGGK